MADLKEFTIQADFNYNNLNKVNEIKTYYKFPHIERNIDYKKYIINFNKMNYSKRRDTVLTTIKLIKDKHIRVNSYMLREEGDTVHIFQRDIIMRDSNLIDRDLEVFIDYKRNLTDKNGIIYDYKNNELQGYWSFWNAFETESDSLDCDYPSYRTFFIDVYNYKKAVCDNNVNRCFYTRILQRETNTFITDHGVIKTQIEDIDLESIKSSLLKTPSNEIKIDTIINYTREREDSHVFFKDDEKYRINSKELKQQQAIRINPQGILTNLSAYIGDSSFGETTLFLDSKDLPSFCGPLIYSEVFNGNSGQFYCEYMGYEYEYTD